MWNQVTLKNLNEYTKKIKKLLESNMILKFVGELGAGKTTFIKNLLSEHPVKSPTYQKALYYGKNFVHIDAYNLTKQEFLSLAIEDELPNKCILIEWADLVEDIINNYDCKKLKIEFKRHNDKRFLKFVIES